MQLPKLALLLKTNSYNKRSLKYLSIGGVSGTDSSCNNLPLTLSPIPLGTGLRATNISGNKLYYFNKAEHQGFIEGIFLEDLITLGLLSKR